MALIVASGGDRPTLAAKAATSTIPIVFAVAATPRWRWARSTASRVPPVNVTGISMFTSELEIKKLDLLHELVPGANAIGFLVNPSNPAAAKDVGDIQAAATAIGKQVHVARAQSEQEIGLAFVYLARQGLDERPCHRSAPRNAMHVMWIADSTPAASTPWASSLVDPVNVYSQADRASKYGLLFVLLTFVGFFMFELIKQLPIHPIQYGLVGLALAIFFLLLVSLSEHIEFGWAYLVAERRLHRPARVLPERGAAQRRRAASASPRCWRRCTRRCTDCWCRRTTRWCWARACCS